MLSRRQNITANCLVCGFLICLTQQIFVFYIGKAFSGNTLNAFFLRFADFLTKFVANIIRLFKSA